MYLRFGPLMVKTPLTMAITVGIIYAAFKLRKKY